MPWLNTKPTHGQLKTISCPHCSKKFRSETNILQHMNQPKGSCYGSTLFKDFDNPTEGVATESAFSRSHGMDQHSCYPEDEPALQQLSEFDEDHNIEMDDAPSFSLDDPEARELGPEQVCPDDMSMYLKVVEKCFSAGRPLWTISGRISMYVEERRTNLYYPWASKQEWEFTLWLLHFGLSMAAANCLLLLEIISDCTSIFLFSNIFQIQNTSLLFRSTKELRTCAEILFQVSEL